MGTIREINVMHNQKCKLALSIIIGTCVDNLSFIIVVFLILQVCNLQMRHNKIGITVDGCLNSYISGLKQGKSYTTIIVSDALKAEKAKTHILPIQKKTRSEI